MPSSFVNGYDFDSSHICLDRHIEVAKLMQFRDSQVQLGHWRPLRRGTMQVVYSNSSAKWKHAYEKGINWKYSPAGQRVS